MVKALIELPTLFNDKNTYKLYIKNHMLLFQKYTSNKLPFAIINFQHFFNSTRRKSIWVNTIIHAVTADQNLNFLYFKIFVMLVFK